MKMATHYETLGVKPSASPEEIRSGYLRRARALHPDRQLGKEPNDARRAEQAMQQVNIAWSVLSNPAKKAEYDGRSTQNVQVRSADAPKRRRAASGEPARRPEPNDRESYGRSIDEEAGDGSVSVWASLPVLVIVGLLLGVLIVTAFADREPADNRPIIEPNRAELSVGDCFAFVGSVPRARSCATGAADGQIVSIGADSGNCPVNSTSIADPTSELFLCWTPLLAGSANTTAG